MITRYAPGYLVRFGKKWFPEGRPLSASDTGLGIIISARHDVWHDHMVITVFWSIQPDIGYIGPNNCFTEIHLTVNTNIGEGFLEVIE